MTDVTARLDLVGQALHVHGIRVPIPREHGAWALLLAAAALATAHPGVAGWPAFGLVGLFLLAFGMQEPLRAVAAGRAGPWRRWLAAYVVLLAAGAAWLVVEHDVALLVPLAGGGALVTAADLVARRLGLQRHVAWRLLGSALLTLVLPATLCLMHPDWAGYAIVLWGLTVAYFGTRLLFVRAAAARRRETPDAARWRSAAIWVHVPLFAGLVGLAVHGFVSAWVWTAFVPGACATLFVHRSLSLRRTGWIEALLLCWFVIAVVASFHLGAFRPLLPQ